MDFIEGIKECSIYNISSNKQEWKDVEMKFKKTMKNANIEKIQRIQNRKLWRVFSIEMEDIKIKNSGNANLKNMFHGTNKTDPEMIYQSEEGFNVNYANEGLWGKAIYFAENSSYSDGYSFKLTSG